MSIFPATPIPQFSYFFEQEYRTTISNYETGLEYRRRGWRFPKRTFVLKYNALQMTTSERDVLYEFFVLNQGAYVPFYYFDFKIRRIIDEFVAYGDGVEDTFDLPSKNTTNDTSLKVYVDGIEKEWSLNIKKDSTGSTFNRGDFTTTNAFFWSSLDLSPYAGTDLGSTPYYIEVLDSAGKKATGYIGAVGAGETLGSEISGDPGFDNVGYWTGMGAGWGVSGGKANAITATDGASIYKITDLSLYINQLIKLVFDADSIAGSVCSYWGTLTGDGDTTIRTTPGTWTTYKNGRSIDEAFSIRCKSAGMTGVFDNLSFKRVTDPPATAVHIVSSLNGTIRNWASIESGFDPNTISSWIIYGCTGTGEGGVDRITLAEVSAEGALITAGFNGQLRINARFKEDKMSEEIFTAYVTRFGLSIFEVKV